MGPHPISIQLCLVYRHLQTCDLISFTQAIVHSSIHFFIHSFFQKNLLSIFFVPVTGLDSESNSDQDR